MADARGEFNLTNGQSRQLTRLPSFPGGPGKPWGPSRPCGGGTKFCIKDCLPLLAVPAHSGSTWITTRESHTGLPATPTPGGPCGPWSPASPLEPCSVGHQFIISDISDSQYLFLNKGSNSNCTFGPSGPTGPVNPANPGGPWRAFID